MEKISEKMCIISSNILNIKKDISLRKKQNQDDIINSKLPFDLKVVFGDLAQIDRRILGEILDKSDKLNILSGVLRKLNRMYPSIFFLNVDFLIYDIGTILKAINNNPLILVGYGFNIDTILILLEYVDTICNGIYDFLRIYIFSNHLYFIRYPVEIKQSHLVTCANIYENIYKKDTTEEIFASIRYFSKHIFAFYQSEIKPEILLPDHRRMVNQKTKESKISITNLRRTGKMIFGLFRGIDDCFCIEGFLYDYIIYDIKTNKPVVIFEYMADLLQFGIDDVLKRRYIFKYDPIQKRVSLGSTLCSYDSIPEILIDKIDLDVSFLISGCETLEKKTFNLGNYINTENNTFEFRNFKGDGSLCMVLDDTKFNYNQNNLILDDGESQVIEAVSIDFDNKTQDIDLCSEMISFINESSTDKKNKKFSFIPNSKSCYINQQCKIIDLVMSNMVKEYNNTIDNQTLSWSLYKSKSQRFYQVFNGIIVDESKKTKTWAQVLVDISIAISNSKKYYLKVNKISINVFNESFLI